MEPINWHDYIFQAEGMRERGQVSLALAVLEPVISQGRERSDLKLVLAAALAQRIVCNKHLDQQCGGKDIAYRLRMNNDIAEGIALDIPDSARAVFYLRRGDTYMMTEAFKDADRWYQRACMALPSDSAESPEYLGHRAEAVTELGDYPKALDILEESLKMVRADKRFRSFHRHIILSGLYARQAKAALKSGRTKLAFQAFWKGYARAIWLIWRHDMPQRFNQYNAEIKRRLQPAVH